MLLVEDEPLIRMIMAEILHEAGFDVAEAETGDLALQMVQHPPQPFTLLVTDFHMPGASNGFDVAHAVRQRWPTIPVIIASGRPDFFQQHWQDQLGYRLLKKPYTPSELVRLAHDLVGA